MQNTHRADVPSPVISIFGYLPQPFVRTFITRRSRSGKFERSVQCPLYEFQGVAWSMRGIGGAPGQWQPYRTEHAQLHIKP
jgi:hypothetical protein